MQERTKRMIFEAFVKARKILFCKPKPENAKRINRKERKRLNANLLGAAILGNSADIVRLLKAGADVDATCGTGWAAIHYAAIHGHPDACALLAEKGADVNINDRNGRTPLHYAARLGHREACAALLYKGANVDVIDGNNETPLDKAKRYNHTEITKLLENAKAKRGI